MSHEAASPSIHLARNTLALRKARDLTQSELARIADLPRSTLTWIESGGGNPSLANLVRLAHQASSNKPVRYSPSG